MERTLLSPNKQEQFVLQSLGTMTSPQNLCVANNLKRLFYEAVEKSLKNNTKIVFSDDRWDVGFALVAGEIGHTIGPVLHTNSIAFLLENETRSFFFSVLRTLSALTWLGIVVSTLLVAVLFSLLFRQRFFTVFFEFISCLLRQRFKYTGMRSSTQRHFPFEMFTCSWLMFSLVISSAFSGCLIGFLAVEHRTPPSIRTIEQLAAAVQKGTHRCFTSKGSSVEGILSQDKYDDKKYRSIIGKSMLNNTRFFITQNVDHLQTNEVLITQRESLEIGAATATKSFYVSEENFYGSYLAFIIPKKSVYTREILTVTRRLTETGIAYRELIHNPYWGYEERFKLNKLYSEREDSLNIIRMQSAFWVLGLGCAVSTVMFYLERFHHFPMS